MLRNTNPFENRRLLRARKATLGGQSGLLDILAFLINQVEQLACKFFQQALEVKKSKKALWQAIRGLFDWFIIDGWEDLYTAIIDRKRVCLKQLMIDTT